LRVPVIVTLHTVLKRPSDNQARIVQKRAAQCAQLIVMSQVARDLLASSYGIRGAKVRVIPHGIPAMSGALDQRALKVKSGVAERFSISTLNGAAAQNKGMALFPRPIAGRYLTS
jgi:hypothetical protein